MQAASWLRKRSLSVTSQLPLDQSARLSRHTTEEDEDLSHFDARQTMPRVEGTTIRPGDHQAYLWTDVSEESASDRLFLASFWSSEEAIACNLPVAELPGWQRAKVVFDWHVLHGRTSFREEIRCQFIILEEIRCQFIILPER